MKTFLIIVIALIIVIGGYYAYEATTMPSNTPNGQVACTMEAKLCPDGSYVGRVPPSCDFAQCPGAASGTPSTSGSNSGTSGINGSVQGGVSY